MSKDYTYALGLKYNWIRKSKVLATVAFQFRYKKQKQYLFYLNTRKQYLFYLNTRKRLCRNFPNDVYNFMLLTCWILSMVHPELFTKKLKFLIKCILINYVLLKYNSTCENGSKGLSDRSKSVSLVRWTNISGCTVWVSSNNIANMILPGRVWENWKNVLLVDNY